MGPPTTTSLVSRSSRALAEQPAEGRRVDARLDGERHRDRRSSLWCDEPDAMLIDSMGVSVDGFIADRAEESN
jgi:hypothetical protein